MSARSARPSATWRPAAATTKAVGAARRRPRTRPAGDAKSAPPPVEPRKRSAPLSIFKLSQYLFSLGSFAVSSACRWKPGIHGQKTMDSRQRPVRLGVARWRVECQPSCSTSNSHLQLIQTPPTCRLQNENSVRNSFSPSILPNPVTFQKRPSPPIGACPQGYVPKATPCAVPLHSAESHSRSPKRTFRPPNE